MARIWKQVIQFKPMLNHRTLLPSLCYKVNLAFCCWNAVSLHPPASAVSQKYLCIVVLPLLWHLSVFPVNVWKQLGACYVCVCVLLWMLVCVWCTCMYVHVYICECVCVCGCLFISAHIHAWVCLWMCVRVYEYVHVWCVYLCKYKHMHLLVCMC